MVTMFNIQSAMEMQRKWESIAINSKVKVLVDCKELSGTVRRKNRSDFSLFVQIDGLQSGKWYYIENLAD